MKYDYLVVGTGLYGSVFARCMKESGKSVLILEKNEKIGGNIATENSSGVPIHLHGPHIFHTNSPDIWNYVNRFTTFRQYQHKVHAFFRDKIYSLPFNLSTYYQFWGVTTPRDAMELLKSQRVKIDHPRNLEEWAISQVGTEIYQTLIYGYTKKQWKRDPKDLPASILKRIPVRFTFNDNYFNDAYQGIPVEGYSHLVEQIVDGIDVRLQADFADIKDWRRVARKLVYSGSIDELFHFDQGVLEYRGLEFEHKTVDGDFQGVSQMNYTDINIPYTRIVEHQHFYCKQMECSTITYEYPVEWKFGMTRYYPINDESNNALYEKYRDRVKKEGDIVVGGRLGRFRYLDMDQVVGQALHHARLECRPNPCDSSTSHPMP